METMNMDLSDEWKHGTWIFLTNGNMEHGNMDHADVHNICKTLSMRQIFNKYRLKNEVQIMNKLSRFIQKLIFAL